MPRCFISSLESQYDTHETPHTSRTLSYWDLSTTHSTADSCHTNHSFIFQKVLTHWAGNLKFKISTAGLVETILKPFGSRYTESIKPGSPGMGKRLSNGNGVLPCHHTSAGFLPMRPWGFSSIREGAKN